MLYWQWKELETYQLFTDEYYIVDFNVPNNVAAVLGFLLKKHVAGFHTSENIADIIT